MEHLQIPHCTCNIHDAVAGVLSQLEQAGLTPSRQTVVNLPSRIRMATLYAVAQSVEGGIVLNTSNLSEDWVGYCTIYGDSAGAFSPLGMYTTEEVIALGRALGLPERFLIKPPSDGLTPSTSISAGVSARMRPSGRRSIGCTGPVASSSRPCRCTTTACPWSSRTARTTTNKPQNGT